MARSDAAFRWKLGRAAVHGDRVPRRFLHQLPLVSARVPGQRPRPLRGGHRSRPVSGGLLLLAPLRVEAEALRRGLRRLPDGGESVRLVRTGYGPARSKTAASAFAGSDCGMVAVGGVAGGLADDVKVGDVVVASEVGYAGGFGGSSPRASTAGSVDAVTRRC